MAIGTGFAQSVPDLLYYKFDEGGGAVTANLAMPGAGNMSSPVVGHTLQPAGGQFGGGKGSLFAADRSLDTCA